jgi:hypothetical protein
MDAQDQRITTIVDHRKLKQRRQIIDIILIAFEMSRLAQFNSSYRLGWPDPKFRSFLSDFMPFI